VQPKAPLGNFIKILAERRIIVRQQHDADDLFAKAVGDSIVAAIHAFGKINLAIALNLNMNQQPLFTAIKREDFDEFINNPLTAVVFLRQNFLQLFIKKFKALAKINGLINFVKI
jgi:hypothetical protein